MENRQNKPPEGEAASGHGGQKFHTDSEQAKLHKSKLRMESREERLNKARERLANQKPPKKPGPIKRIARIAGHETHAFLHGKVYQEEHDNVGVEGGHFVERSGEAALHYGRHKVRRAIREHPAKAPPCGVPVHQGHGGLPFPQVCTGAAGGAERRRPVMASPQAETGVPAQGAGNRPSRPPRPPNKPRRPWSGLSGKRQRSSSGIPWERCLHWAVCWWC